MIAAIPLWLAARLLTRLADRCARHAERRVNVSYGGRAWIDR